MEKPEKNDKIENNIAYKPGDIILVSFASAEKEETKQRPALVLSTESYHLGRRELIMAAVTGNTGRILTGDTALNEWKKAGLLYPTVVTAVIRTMKQDMVRRKLGSITPEDFHSVIWSLKEILSL
ncbi:MAG: type II toxin-antitoxin system PemK/MazF family toxin [Candidatus Eremiobacteraeota bacterium]|nr:type II toxin-antitoxin system PemK/MazF family toxin [Candidatus Eremiobacteraeota bacterium]